MRMLVIMMFSFLFPAHLLQIIIHFFLSINHGVLVSFKTVLAAVNAGVYWVYTSVPAPCAALLVDLYFFVGIFHRH